MIKLTDAQRKILHLAIDTWDSHQQINKAVEELSELIQRLMKYQNRKVSGPGFENYSAIGPIAEEMADVFIMMNQLLKIFEFDDLIQEYVDKKFARLETYL